MVSTTHTSSRSRRGTTRTATTKQYTGRTYKTPQPTDEPNATAYEEPGVHVINPLQYQQTDATLAYYAPASLPEAQTQFRDDLKYDRCISITDFECDKDHIGNTGHVITTTLKQGDVFYFGTHTGLYEFVGVTKKPDPKYPEILVFEPFNEPAKTDTSSSTKEHVTYFKSDFGHKLSPYILNNGETPLTHVRLNPDFYDDLSHVASLDDIPARPTEKLTQRLIDSHPQPDVSIIETGKQITSRIRESITELVTSNKPDHSVDISTTGVVEHTVHTATDNNVDVHGTVYQAQDN